MSKKNKPMPKKYRCRDCGGYFIRDDMAKSGLTESKQVGYCKPCKALRVRASKAKIPKLEKPIPINLNAIIAGHIAEIGRALMEIAGAMLKGCDGGKG